MSLGREIELVQRHKAEEDMAVAAASILARNEFVTRLGALEKEFEMALPKGASALVDKAAKEFVSRYGAENLTKVAKTPLSHRPAVPKVCPNRPRWNGENCSNRGRVPNKNSQKNC